MNLRTLTRRLAAFVLVSGSFAAPAGATVTLIAEGSLIRADANNFEGANQTTTPLTAIPGAYAATADASSNFGDDYSTIRAALSQSAFAFTLDQLASFSQTAGRARVNFTVDVDTAYAVSGSFAAVGVDYNQRLGASLTAGESRLYYSDQADFNAADHTFVLGGQEGTLINRLEGSATGVLHAGQVYTFDLLAGLEPIDDPTGTGTVTLSFAPVANVPGGGQVPLPAAVWLGGVAGAGVLARARARQK